MLNQIAEIVAFVIIAWALWKYVRPMLAKMVADRQDVVQKQVEDSEEAERLNAEAQRRYDAAVDEAKQEAARLRDDARADATRIKEELIEQAKAEVERMKQRGADQLVAERDQLVRALRGQIGGQSMELAERLVREELAADSRKSASVDAFLAQLGDLTQRGSKAESSASTTGGGA
ncbi:F0F1 ATP synthase subunit B [Pseudonocardia sp. CA-107938]|uniref:F0F1 ATP synthase subunit B n=1 Tax=Pseudonocardia sp. CA-107938 TaxID=3240021 RepID=UPI003D8ACE78